MLHTKLYPAKSERVRWVERKEETIILNPANGIYHRLNRTAAYIWQICNGIKNIETICRLTAKKYGISINTARSDVLAVINYLKKDSLIKLHIKSDRFYPTQQ